MLTVWIVSALFRTLTYLKMKDLDYKLSIMKQFTCVFLICILIFSVIRIAKILFEVINDDTESWENEHNFQISWFMAYTAILLGSAWVFRPQDGSKMLAEVDELLDETLTEVGTFDGENNRVDSVAYAEEIDRKLKQRVMELGTMPAIEF